MSDDLVERVAIAIDNAICNGDQSSVAMELTSEEIKVLVRAAIAVCMEEAAKVAENASFQFTQTTPSTVEVVDVRHTIAAAIRALVKHG